MGVDIKDADYVKSANYYDGSEPILVRDWSVAEENKAKRK